MSALKVLSIFGTRPEAVKMAPVVQELARTPGVESRVCVTAQHREMLDQVLALFNIQPARDLNLMRADQSLTNLTAAIFTHLDPLLAEYRPEWLLAQGDTTTVMASALAAFYRQVKFGHVEAGLRSFNRAMPEEINRIVSDHLADLHFCPTNRAMANLEHEGIKEHVFQVGDVMADALFHFVKIAREKSTILDQVQVAPGRYGLVTIHRSGNVDVLENLKGIMDGLAGIDIPLVFPVHPRTRKMLSEFNMELPNHIKAIDPVGYLDMLALQENAGIILTDSGGIQKEAYLLGVRCITLREETEWVETVQSGWNTLVGTKPEAIRDAYIHFKPSGERQQFFGDGSAADKIIAAIKNFEQ